MRVKQVDVYLTKEQLMERVREMGDEISREYGEEPLLLLCILKGSIFFTCDLARHLTCPVEMDFMTVSSYGAGTASSGNVTIKKDLDIDIAGKHVLVVEDIIDSGRTLHFLLKNLRARNPKSLRLATLLDKPDRRVCDVAVDYVGFAIPDFFVVGYGLDYDQKYRNLPYIGIARVEE